jgi:hypothetical protein
LAKPFSIQAPEDIAKEYMGNKQRIAQAAQMGVVDPTAAVLAGMFIDRMRSAQVMEAGQTPTVAQQVLGGGGSPMPSPQGLGSVPSPVPPPPPQMQPMAPPQGMPPQGMAMGGLVGLPVPDAMFDEPTNGGFDDGYAGGGLVAFADGGPAQAPNYYGYSIDPRQNMAIARELAGVPESKYSSALEQEHLETLTPGAQEKQRKGRIWDVLTDVGFRMAASRSPTLFGAIGEAGMGALPAAREAQRLSKADEKFARRALADLEAGRNTAKAQLAAQALQMQQMAIQGYEAQTGREFQAGQNQLDRDMQFRIASMRNAGGGGGGGGGDGEGGAATKPLSATNVTERLKEIRMQADESFESAKDAWKAKNTGGTSRALQNFGAARAAYNKLAAQHGMPPLKEPNYGSSFKGYKAQSGSRGADAGRGRTVQDGQIKVISATPIP